MIYSLYNRLGTNEDLIYVCIRHKYISIYFNGGGLVAKVVSDSCNPMNCSLPDSSVYGLLQARILEWVATPFSKGSSRPRHENPGLLHYKQVLNHLSHQVKLSSRFLALLLCAAQ